MKRITLNKRGFTLVELMIATVIFSTILLATMTILIQLGRMYYKGVIVNRTQETTRSITDEISQQLQFGADRITTDVSETFNGTNVKTFCIGTQRYNYVINGKVSRSAEANQPPGSGNGNAIRHAFWRDTIDATHTNCTPLNLTLDVPVTAAGAQNGTNGRELLGENMRLIASPQPECDNATGVCSLTIGVLYGDNDLLTPNPDDGAIPQRCANTVGSQWCAGSTLSTQIFKRLRQGS